MEEKLTKREKHIMAFDISKYVVLETITIPVSATTDIMIQKYQYDGGEIKVKLCKNIKLANGTEKISNDIGGFSPDLIPQIIEGVKAMM